MAQAFIVMGLLAAMLLGAVSCPQGVTNSQATNKGSSHVPSYRVARKWHSKEAIPTLLLFVSIRDRNVNLEQVRSLVCQVDNNNRGERQLSIHVFVDHEAAKNWAPPYMVEIPPKNRDYEAALIALFVRDTDGGRSLEWYGLPSQENRQRTTLDVSCEFSEKLRI